MFRDHVLQHYRDKGYTLRERCQVRGASGTVHACDLVAQGPLGSLLVQFEDYGGFEGPELESVHRVARDIGATPVVAAEQVSQTVRRHAARAGVVVLDDDALHAPPVPETTGGEPEPEPYPPWPGADDAGEPEERPWPADARARPDVPSRMEPGEVDDLVREWGSQRPKPTRRQDPGFWKYGDAAEADPEPESTPVPTGGGFTWLQRQEAASVEEPVVEQAPVLEPDDHPLGRAQRQRIDALTETRQEPPAAQQTQQDPVQTRGPVRTGLRWLVGFVVAGASAGVAFLGLGMLVGAF